MPVDYTAIRKRIQTFAVDHYEQGWDGWVETLDPQDQYRIIHKASSFPHAMRLAQLWVADWCSSQAVGAENSAMYDTGDEATTERYEQYILNDTVQHRIALFNKACYSKRTVTFEIDDE